MSARCAVQCVVVLLALSLSACGGSDPTPPAAAASAPVAHHHGHLRHSEYVRLKRITVAHPMNGAIRSHCDGLGHATRLMTQVQLECRSFARGYETTVAAAPAARACAAARDASCLARVFDRMAARLEALVLVDHSVHVAAVDRGLARACRSFLQLRPLEVAKVRRMAESLREISAEVEGGVWQGVLSAIGRYDAALRWTGPTHGELKHLKRCARA